MPLLLTPGSLLALDAGQVQALLVCGMQPTTLVDCASWASLRSRRMGSLSWRWNTKAHASRSIKAHVFLSLGLPARLAVELGSESQEPGSRIPEPLALESWWAALEAWGWFLESQSRWLENWGWFQNLSSQSHCAELTSPLPSSAFWDRACHEKMVYGAPGSSECQGLGLALKDTIKEEILECSLNF